MLLRRQKRWEEDREYRQRPEVEKRLKEYNQRPEIKKKHREYYQRPEIKKRIKEYYQKPEIKKRRRKYMREYNQKPEIRKKLKERDKQRQKKFVKIPTSTKLEYVYANGVAQELQRKVPEMMEKIAKKLIQ